MAAERRFRAMGSDVHLIAVGGPADMLDRARRQVDDLERRWSRFLDDSEISRLNVADGRECRVSGATFIAISRAVAAWEATQGRFDPTVQRALVAAGYDRTFDALEDVPTEARSSSPPPGCAGIALDEDRSTVTLPPGVGLDLGGIGKGLGADMVVAGLLEAGCAGACANLGGDVRVAGDAPSHDGWVVAVDNPFTTGDELVRLALSNGAVATSSTRRRRWHVGDEERHHLIDPASGQSVDNGMAAVTAVAGEAWWAEVLAKVAMVAGPADGSRLLSSLGGAGLLVRDDGGVSATVGLEEFLR